MNAGSPRGPRLDRRAVLGGMTALAAAPALADPEPAPILLWPGGAPGGPAPDVAETVSGRGSLDGITRPRLRVYRPVRPGGVAVVVMAGGAYAHLEAASESTPTCRWLQARGITAFELLYRLPRDGWSRDAPFQDAHRGLRLVRSRAADFGVDPARLGVLGFSAGGHLAGMAAATAAMPSYSPVDAADAQSARPDFAALIYPVVSLRAPLDDSRTRRELLGPRPAADDAATFSLDARIGAGMPPTFLAHAFDDPIAAVDHSLLASRALRNAGVAQEVHLFQQGGHGWALGKSGTPPRAWPGLFLAWFGEIGMPLPPNTASGDGETPQQP